MKQTFSLFILIFVFLASNLHPDELAPHSTIYIPVKDGTQLPTDLYLPHDKVEKLPCILIRSPAGRNSPIAKAFAPLSQLGYVVAIQDTRSVLDNEGKTIPYGTDSWCRENDGQETIQWLAKSPITNGKIGTLGFSAMGITQILLSPSAPEALQCQFIGTAPASLYHYAIFPSGVLLKHQVESWLGYYAKDTGVCSYITNQLLDHDFWNDFDTIKVAHEVNVPAVHQGGWYDTFLQGTIDAFLARQNGGGPKARGQQKLLIGPWSHFWPLTNKLGDFIVPLQGMAPPENITPQRLFDYYLKGIDNGMDKIPAITYYVMGPFDGSPSSGNVWRTAEIWPIPAKDTPFYLVEGNKLQEEINVEKMINAAKVSYIHDPLNPVPTLGGQNLFLESGPIDQRPIESRADVLLFTTEPLQEDTEVTGRISAKLFVSSNHSDTNVAVRLCDVYPDGRSILICDGIHRTGLLSLTQPHAVTLPEHPIEISVDLWSSSIVFAKGHRIRISICGSNYPRYENNWNVGVFGTHQGVWNIAENAIHMGKSLPSRLILPVVRKGDKWLVRD